MKWFNAQNGKCRACQRAIWDSVSCLNLEAVFEQAFVWTSKMLRIVPLHCGSSLPVVCGGGISLKNSLTLTTPAQLLLRDLSLLLVCVVPPDLTPIYISRHLKNKTITQYTEFSLALVHYFIIHTKLITLIIQ